MGRVEVLVVGHDGQWGLSSRLLKCGCKSGTAVLSDLNGESRDRARCR